MKRNGHKPAHLLCLSRFPHLFLPPSINGLQRGNQRPSALRQAVLDGWRDGVVLLPANQAVRLQLSQTLRQHGGGDADDFPFQLLIAQRLALRVRDVPQDRELLFLPYQLHGIQNGAQRIVDVLILRQRLFPHVHRSNYHKAYSAGIAFLIKLENNHSIGTTRQL